MQRRRALLLINRRSRRGAEDLGDIVRLLGDLDIDAVETDDAAAIAGAADQDFQLVIVGGGDGSIHRALPGLLACKLPLGVLPLGTGNDLARTLTIPLDLPEACRVIAEGRIHRIDLGEVNGDSYVNVASMGVSVAVTRNLNPETKKALGPVAYVLSTWRALRDSRPFVARIIRDGEVFVVRSMQIAVGNGRHYGGGMTVHETARLDDSTLHLYSLAPRPLWRYAMLAPAFRWGTHHRSEAVTALHGHSFRIETSRPLSINTDGEVTTRTPAEFRVRPRILPVFVPARYASGPEVDHVP